MISLCPSGSSPIPRIMMGVTAIMVMMTTDANTSKVIVARDKQLMRVLDLI